MTNITGATRIMAPSVSADMIGALAAGDNVPNRNRRSETATLLGVSWHWTAPGWRFPVDGPLVRALPGDSDHCGPGRSINGRAVGAADSRARSVAACGGCGQVLRHVPQRQDPHRRALARTRRPDE